jgi:thymidylate kinase
MSSALRVVRELFDNVEREGIHYCLWKGSEHLGESLSGQGDLDLLVDQSQDARFESILGELGYKRFISQAWASYPGIEDWIGFDPDTGKLVHLHLYYKLMLGTRFVKEYHLPWENLILESAIKDSEYKVFIADPNLELILLCVQIGLNNTLSDFGSFIPGQRPLVKGFNEKYSFLMKRIDEYLINKFTQDMFGEQDGTQFASTILQGNFQNREKLHQLKTLVNKSLYRYRMYDQMKVVAIFTSRAIGYLMARMKRKLKLNSHLGKRMQNQGSMIAFIGSDGSGKSTLSGEIQQWLAWKIDANKIYLGSGDGSVDVPVRLLKSLALKSPTEKGNHELKGSSLGNKNFRRETAYLKEAASCLLDLSITNQRHRKLVEANQARTKGSILITDRYPQNQFVGIYDGPRVARKNTGSRLRKYFSILEEKKYQEITKIAPDIVFKLHVPLEVAIQRKPDHNVENIKQKAEITNQLRFSESKVVDIDASQPLVEVLNSVKQVVWESI